MVLIRFFEKNNPNIALCFNSNFLNNENFEEITRNLKHHTMHHYIVKIKNFLRFSNDFRIEIFGENDPKYNNEEFTKKLDIIFKYLLYSNPWKRATYNYEIYNKKSKYISKI